MNGSKQSIAPLVKVGARNQVTIPKAVVEKVNIRSGDYVEFTLEGRHIVIRPKAVVDRDDAWFWSKEWQEKEREADEAIAKGDYKEFKSADALIRELHS